MKKTLATLLVAGALAAAGLSAAAAVSATGETADRAPEEAVEWWPDTRQAERQLVAGRDER